MKRIAIIIGLILPLSVAALEYRNLSLYYTDAPFLPSEAAGISLLTSIGAVEGNPDGTFRSNRTINRAEFLKIVLASYPKVRVSASDAGSCFRDVKYGDWFSPYVCLAKKRGMVSGYPDGQFKPGRSVNYAEALKILGELYDYVAYSADDEEWYAGYVRAAKFNKTALPSSIKYDRALTRGQMARLAAAYRAHYEGELATYRLAEKSLNLVIAQEIAEQVEEEVQRAKEQEELKEEVEVTEEPEEVVYQFPATNRFLVLGSRQLIASGMFQPRSESVIIANVTVKFREEAKNIRSLYLVDEMGEHIAEFKPDIFDKYELTWKAQGDAVERYSIPLQGKELGLEALVQIPGAGHSEEPIYVKWMSMNVYPTGAKENGYQLIAADTSYPVHQTAMANITSATNNKPPVVDLGEGEGVMIAEFEISGEYIEGGEVRLNHLTFTIAQRRGVILTNYKLGAFHSTQTVPCSLGEGIYINCMNIPASVGMIERGSVLVQLWADINIDETVSDPMLKIDFDKPGMMSTSIIPGTMGHLRWTDGSAGFNWVELPGPMAEGSVWK